MALSSYLASVVMDSSLEDWVAIGSGGFGQIYKARHRRWCCDVAVKLLHHHNGTSSSLLHEVNMMRQGSNPYVIQVLGVFQGQPPNSGPSKCLGLVMEFMERGSLALLQKKLTAPPPWPLVVRLAHQVALGINFLHTRNPAVLHLDLKPSNVLLDADLNAKLTDFGLSRIYYSVSRASKKHEEDEGGTTSYMPPEAFDLSKPYTPTKASDIYSYGILLWSIVTGKQPYPHAMSSLVRFRIPRGDRPSLEGLEGGEGLTHLMERCWEPEPRKRPSSMECTTATEKLYKIQKPAVRLAVHTLLKTLDEKDEEEERLAEQIERLQMTQRSASPSAGCLNNCDEVPTGRAPVQEVAAGRLDNHQSAVKDSPGTASRGQSDPELPKKEDPIKASSAQPVLSAPSSSSSGRSPQKVKDSIPERLHIQRQLSSPQSPSPLHLHLENVTGFQYGNNNTMNISIQERRRHQTAPSSLNPPPHPPLHPPLHPPHPSHPR